MEEVLVTTHISDNKKKKYQIIIEEFDKYFKVKKNMIYERAHFNRHSQLPEESIDRLITEVHSLTDSCKFGTMKE